LLAICSGPPKTVLLEKGWKKPDKIKRLKIAAQVIKIAGRAAFCFKKDSFLQNVSITHDNRKTQ
tara:strand:- start:1087 stop:1278 length:192 start_codon:yes stop_codon:yes gene_type:complete